MAAETTAAGHEAVTGADVYVVVGGFRCGSPVRDDPMRSYTEPEFGAATDTGNLRLAFLRAPDAADPDDLFTDAEFVRRP